MLRHHRMGRFSKDYQENHAGCSKEEGPGAGLPRASSPPPEPRGPQDSLAVLVLCNLASAEEVNDGAFYADLLDDLREACGAHGRVVSVHVPRTRVRLLPGQHAMSVDLLGFGRAYVEFEREAAAAAALRALGGRYYNGRFVLAQRMPLDEYAAMVAENEARLRAAHARYVDELRANITRAAALAMPIEAAQRNVLLLTGLETGTRNGIPRAISNKPFNSATAPPAAAPPPAAPEFDISGITLPPVPGVTESSNSNRNPAFAPPPPPPAAAPIPSLHDLETGNV